MHTESRITKLWLSKAPGQQAQKTQIKITVSADLVDPKSLNSLTERIANTLNIYYIIYSFIYYSLRVGKEAMSY